MRWWILKGPWKTWSLRPGQGQGPGWKIVAEDWILDHFKRDPNAGLKVSDIAAVKSHNPFAINDINMAKKIGFDVMTMNS